MEHRWGRRLAVDIPIRLRLPLCTAKRGRLTNVSLSGGFIATVVDVRILTRLLVVLDGPDHSQTDAVTVAAYVARKTDDGLGVEWCEFAPAAVVELVKQATHAQLPFSMRGVEPLTGARVAVVGALLKHGS
jgi:hypothetical protein